MLVPTRVGLHDPHYLKAWMEHVMPQYTYEVRNSFVIVGDGQVTGVIIQPKPNGQANLAWGFPNMGLQIVLVILIVLSLLPGMLVFLIVWLVARPGINRIKADVAHLLQTGTAPPAPLGAIGGS